MFGLAVVVALREFSAAAAGPGTLRTLGDGRPEVVVFLPCVNLMLWPGQQ